MPDGLSFKDAAAVPEAFITAYDAMVTQAELRAGETVLVHAVGSGVGTAAVQIARALRRAPLGTARTADKLERAQQLGLDAAFAVESGKFADDVCAPPASAASTSCSSSSAAPTSPRICACAAPRGRIVLVGLLAGARGELDLGALLRKRVADHRHACCARARSRRRSRSTQTFERHVVPLFARGRVKPVVDRVMPLAEAGRAHARMASNEGFGKIVLAVRLTRLRAALRRPPGP